MSSAALSIEARDLARVRLSGAWSSPSYKIDLGRWNYAVKRVLDTTAAVIALVALIPLLLVIAAAVQATSDGPAFFTQKRVGKNGRTFRVVKFRTMAQDAERRLVDDPELRARYIANDFKLPEGQDSRVTNVGRFLRSTSLDELPQLINVVRGEMSLVGPRPVVPAELREYGDRASSYLAVKPGITGWWQVNGRSTVEYPERIDLDEYYADHWSLAFDTRIILRTIPAVLRRRGAH